MRPRKETVRSAERDSLSASFAQGENLIPDLYISRLIDGYNGDRTRVLSIVADFGALMEDMPIFGRALDTLHLPHDKIVINNALLLAMLLLDDHAIRDKLAASILCLANFQNNVGMKAISPIENADATTISIETMEDAEKVFAALDEYKPFKGLIDRDWEVAKSRIEAVARLQSAGLSTLQMSRISGHERFVADYKRGDFILVDKRRAGHLFRAGIISSYDARKQFILRIALFTLLVIGAISFFFVPWYVASMVVALGLVVASIAQRQAAETVFRTALRNPKLFDLANRTSAIRVSIDQQYRNRRTYGRYCIFTSRLP